MLDHGVNPTKAKHSEKLTPRLAQMMDGFEKEDPPTEKKLPVEVDVPEYIAKGKSQCGAAQQSKRYRSESLMKAIGDLVLIAFYFLLRVGEYTVKGTKNWTKQTKQFCLKDVTFFKRDENNKLTQISRGASDKERLAAHSATMRIRNQKNGWKNVCINQEKNGQLFLCPVKALARRYNHIQKHVRNAKKAQDTYLSTYFESSGKRGDVTDKDVRINLKIAAEGLHYLESRGIPTIRVDTHSLRSGGGNALSLAGYSDRQIKKMGRWRGETFMEYIREELQCFSEGMSKSMSRMFNFVNVAGGACHDVTPTIIVTDYNTNVVSSDEE